MRRTFNLGVGMILVVAPENLAGVLESLALHGPAWVVGRTVPGAGVRFLGGPA
jgi:phosphoribosylaminoimidazole (AIR) synthetase